MYGLRKLQQLGFFMSSNGILMIGEHPNQVFVHMPSEWNSNYLVRKDMCDLFETNDFAEALDGAVFYASYKSYDIVINESQRLALMAILRGDSPDKHLSDGGALQYWVAMLSELPEVERQYPGTDHGFCL